MELAKQLKSDPDFRAESKKGIQESGVMEELEKDIPKWQLVGNKIASGINYVLNMGVSNTPDQTYEIKLYYRYDELNSRLQIKCGNKRYRIDSFKPQRGEQKCPIKIGELKFTLIYSDPYGFIERRNSHRPRKNN